MDEGMTKVWQSFLKHDYHGKEAEILAALVATLFAKGALTREEVDKLKEMVKSGESK
jgi:hypothetical protein